MKHSRGIIKPGSATHSTFLVANEFYHNFIKPNFSKRRSMKIYLHKLLADPAIESKLRFLQSNKWKKVYQEKGQALHRVDFVPDDSDWAQLSIFSNATGFSRCFIFVYLLLLDMGYLKLPVKEEYGTPYKIIKKLTNYRLYCEVSIDITKKLLWRTMKT
jgi:hypothetical protein